MFIGLKMDFKLRGEVFIFYYILMDTLIIKKDNFIDEDLNTKIEAFFENVEWKYGEKSINSMMKEALPHWSKYFYMDKTRNGVKIDDVVFEDPCIQQLYEKIKIHITESNVGMEAKLLRSYANGHTFGNDANIPNWPSSYLGPLQLLAHSSHRLPASLGILDMDSCNWRPESPPCFSQRHRWRGE